MAQTEQAAADRAKSLSLAWADYERNILDPINASQVQRTEMRRAFYAGAVQLMSMIMFGLSACEEVTPADERYLLSIQAEIQEYIDKVKRGVA